MTRQHTNKKHIYREVKRMGTNDRKRKQSGRKMVKGEKGEGEKQRVGSRQDMGLGNNQAFNLLKIIRSTLPLYN
jgi:hypothetical protein